MRQPVVLDLETKFTFRQFPEPRQLGISVVGIYDFASRQLQAFFETELSQLYPILEKASLTIGFNIDSFDFPVLQSYYPGDIKTLATFDLLEDLRLKIGRRISLNDLAVATLNKSKSGHGLQAVELYKEGKVDQLKRYCLDDVSLTKELFDYGVANGAVYYRGTNKNIAIKVDWNKYLKDPGKSDVSLTLPF